MPFEASQAVFWLLQYSDKFMHGIVLYGLCITILYKSVTIKNGSRIMRNLTKHAYKTVNLSEYAAVLLGLKE